MLSDVFYLDRCDELAQEAAATGNSPAGALVVYNNNIIAEAAEAATIKNDITCHAEIEAIRRSIMIAGEIDLSAYTLYSSHEPCIMCAYVIRFYRIGRVVYRNTVDCLGSVSSSVPLLTKTDVPSHWSIPPDVVQICK